MPPADDEVINVSGKAFNTIRGNDFSFYEEINHIVQEEPNSALDPETLGVLASIGIEKGKPVAPDARIKKILTESAAVGNATARAYRVPQSQEGDRGLSQQRVAK